MQRFRGKKKFQWWSVKPWFGQRSGRIHFSLSQLERLVKASNLSIYAAVFSSFLLLNSHILFAANATNSAPSSVCKQALSRKASFFCKLGACFAFGVSSPTQVVNAQESEPTQQVVTRDNVQIDELVNFVQAFVDPDIQSKILRYQQILTENSTPARKRMAVMELKRLLESANVGQYLAEAPKGVLHEPIQPNKVNARLAITLVLSNFYLTHFDQIEYEASREFLRTLGYRILNEPMQTWLAEVYLHAAAEDGYEVFERAAQYFLEQGKFHLAAHFLQQAIWILPESNRGHKTYKEPITRMWNLLAQIYIQTSNARSLEYLYQAATYKKSQYPALYDGVQSSVWEKALSQNSSSRLRLNDAGILVMYGPEFIQLLYSELAFQARGESSRAIEAKSWLFRIACPLQDVSSLVFHGIRDFLGKLDQAVVLFLLKRLGYGAIEYLEPVRKIIKDAKNRYDRLEALETLAAMTRANQELFYGEMLSYLSVDYRESETIAEIFSHKGPHKIGVPILLNLLKHKSPNVRRSALLALVNIDSNGRARFWPQIIEAVLDGNHSVSNTAIGLIDVGSLTRNDIHSLLVGFERAGDSARLHILEVLGDVRVAKNEVVKQLRKAIPNSNYRVKIGIIKTLMRLGATFEDLFLGFAQVLNETYNGRPYVEGLIGQAARDYNISVSIENFSFLKAKVEHGSDLEKSGALYFLRRLGVNVRSDPRFSFDFDSMKTWTRSYSSLLREEAFHFLVRYSGEQLHDALPEIFLGLVDQYQPIRDLAKECYFKVELTEADLELASRVLNNSDRAVRKYTLRQLNQLRDFPKFTISRVRQMLRNRWLDEEEVSLAVSLLLKIDRPQAFQILTDDLDRFEFSRREIIMNCLSSQLTSADDALLVSLLETVDPISTRNALFLAGGEAGLEYRIRDRDRPLDIRRRFNKILKRIR